MCRKLSTGELLAICHQAEKFQSHLEGKAASVVAHELGRLIFTFSGNRALLLFGEVLFSLDGATAGNSIEKLQPPIQTGNCCMEAIARLSTAFLKSNEGEMVDALNALFRVVSRLA